MRSGPAILLLLALALAAPPASANPYLPPAGKVWTGVASGRDISDFVARTGKHPAVWQHWIQWGDGLGYAFARSTAARTRVMLHLSTARGQNTSGRISPGEIARGKGDGYLIGLNAALAEHDAPVYVRLLAEMNNCDLACSAYDCNGRRRDKDHSPARFKQAWRRMVIVLRGGDVNAKLRAAGLPRLRGEDTELPIPQVAFLW